MSLFKIAFKRFYIRCAGKQEQPSTLLRVKWAIHEKAHFEGLIHHLQDFIDGLNQILPVPRETQDRIIEEDIASILKIESLQLVQAACEGSYSSWSTETSAVIAASEARTVDRQNIEERLRDVEGVNEIHQSEIVEGKNATNKAAVGLQSYLNDITLVQLPRAAQVRFIVTDRCSMHIATNHCDQDNFGDSCLDKWSQGFNHRL